MTLARAVADKEMRQSILQGVLYQGILSVTTGHFFVPIR